MSRDYKIPRKYSATRKFKGKCENCGKALDEKDAVSYVDGNNISITRNAPWVCKECYQVMYGR